MQISKVDNKRGELVIIIFSFSTDASLAIAGGMQMYSVAGGMQMYSVTNYSTCN